MNLHLLLSNKKKAKLKSHFQVERMLYTENIHILLTNYHAFVFLSNYKLAFAFKNIYMKP